MFRLFFFTVFVCLSFLLPHGSEARTFIPSLDQFTTIKAFNADQTASKDIQVFMREYSPAVLREWGQPFPQNSGDQYAWEEASASTYLFYHKPEASFEEWLNSFASDRFADEAEARKRFEKIKEHFPTRDHIVNSPLAKRAAKDYVYAEIWVYDDVRDMFYCFLPYGVDKNFSEDGGVASVYVLNQENRLVRGALNDLEQGSDYQEFGHLPVTNLVQMRQLITSGQGKPDFMNNLEALNY